MADQFDIQIVNQDSFEAAFELLERFFREEGFDTPAEAMRASLRVMLDNPASAVFIARQAGQAVGVATTNSWIGLEYGRSAELEDLYVLPEARGSGIAGALIEAVCEWCQQAGVSTVLVTVDPVGNERHHLRDYYQRRGFRNTGRVVMERSLLG